MDSNLRGNVRIRGEKIEDFVARTASIVTQEQMLMFKGSSAEQPKALEKEEHERDMNRLKEGLEQLSSFRDEQLVLHNTLSAMRQDLNKLVEANKEMLDEDKKSKKDFGTLEQKFKKRGDELKDIKAECKDIKAECKEIKAEFGKLKGEFAKLKGEVSG